MRQATVVIGSNYGDEGKGLTAYNAVRNCGTTCLNILINGGPQRGHTVETPEGKRHIFQHFGSGCAAGAVTYADVEFMINPTVFCREREALAADFPEACLRTIIHPACRVTLPYDMILNQIIEEARGIHRHGSCGLGIFETRKRYETMDRALRWGALIRLDYSAFADYCREIALEYVPERISQAGFTCPEEWKEILRSEGLIEHAWEDIRKMIADTELSAGWKETAAEFSHLVFEAGQGLALDEGKIDRDPHLTPSHTTSYESARRIAELGDVRTEILYVTRTYLTRHGAGPFPTECPMSDISPDIRDKTNVPNPFQQTLRYGRFDGDEVRERIFSDLEATRKCLPGIRAAIVITHLNETGNKLFGNMTIGELTQGFDRVGYSDTPYTVEWDRPHPPAS